MKSDILKNEIALINNEQIKNFVTNTLENVTEYFYIGMASSTGKYHPTCTCKKGGIITHTKRVVYIANRMCTGLDIKDINRDIVLASCILHDIAKTNKNTSTYEDYENHPINAEKYFAKKEILKASNDIDNTFMEEKYSKIVNCIKYHMGLWTPSSIKKSLQQYNKLEWIVYVSDYLAATKDLITPKDTE